MTGERLRDAHDLDALGWNVLPAPEGGKAPTVNWREFQDQRTTTKLPLWFGTGSLNLFVMTGSVSELLVLDNDSEAAEALWRELLGDVLDRTTAAATRKGRHYYFQLEPGQVVRSWSHHRDGVDFDVRAEGSGVIAPPSVHESGHLYEWVRGPEHIQPVPQQLLSAADAGLENRPHPGAGPQPRSMLSHLLSNPAGEGGRNNWLTQVCGHYAKMFRSQQDTYLVQSRIAANLLSPSLPVEESEHTIESVWSIEKRRVEDERLEADAVASGWIPRPIDELADPDGDRPLPTIGRMDDGRALFYAGRVNSLIGESGTAKSWIALHVAGQVIDAGGLVVFVDYEDHPEGILARLRDLGQSPVGLHYVGPPGPLAGAADALDAWLVDQRPDLVIIDSTGESLALEGLKPNEDEAVAAWFRHLPRRFATAGAAVVVTDHVVKRSQDRGLYATGSQRKRAAIDGASYSVAADTPVRRGGRGSFPLKVLKDRCGTYTQGTTLCRFVLDASTDPYTASLGSISGEGGSAGSSRPELAQLVLEFVIANPGCSQNNVIGGVAGNTGHKREALRELVQFGSIRLDQTGSGHRYWPPMAPTDGPDG